MTRRSDPSTTGERKLRSAIANAAPTPSAKHNDSVMRAARENARAIATGKNDGRTWPGAAWFGIAASVLLAISIAWFPDDEMTDRIADRGEAAANVVPADGAVLKAGPSRFEWPSIATEKRYRLSVYDDAALLIWSTTDISETQWVVRDEFQLSPGARYFWTVDILDARQTSTLGPFWFTVE